jgi:hypothetical protein
MLSFFSDIFNELKEHVEELDGYRHLFKGIDEEDEDKKLDREDKMVRTTHFIDEIRARRDEPTLAESMKKLYINGDLRLLGSPNLYGKWNTAMYRLHKTFKRDEKVKQVQVQDRSERVLQEEVPQT